MPSVAAKLVRHHATKAGGGGLRQDLSLQQASSASATARAWLYAAVLCICTVAVYLPVHHHPFCINDDEQYVVSNPHLRGELGWKTIRWAFTTHDLANWHPLTWLSHAVDVRIFHLDPAGHHDVNILLHIINALLLFWVLRRATGFTGRSFIVAALFALHPINVETVAWIAERKSLLSMLFFLLALGAYRSYASKPGTGRYLLVTILYALGLMAKPQIITLPLVLLLWDYWPLRRMFNPERGTISGADRAGRIGPRKFSSLVLEKLPLLLLSAGSAFMTLRAQRLAGALRYFPLSMRLENAIVSYVRYIGKAFWPSPLAAFYPHVSYAPSEVWASLVLLLGVTGFVIYRRRQQYLAVGWFWYLGTLVPMIGVVQVGEQAMADRYAYLSFIGLFFMICWSVPEWAKERRFASSWLMAPSAIALVILAALTYRQLSYWSSNVALWEHTVAATNGSFEAEENLGVALLEAGRPEDAMPHFKRVIATASVVSPDMGREQSGYAAVAHLYLGAFDQQHGKPEAAIDHYEAVLALARNFSTENVYANVPPVLLKIKATALANMGYAYNALGKFAQAQMSFEDALRLEPHDAREWVGLGMADQRLGDLAGAIRAYSQAARIKPSDVNLLLLAQAMQRNGQAEEARSARQQAALLTQNIATAQHTVDKLLAH